MNDVMPNPKSVFVPAAITVAFFVCVMPARVQAYEVTLFPAAKVYNADPRILHRGLGLDESGLIVEGFENGKLIEGLTVPLANRDDTPLNLWDGKRVAESFDNAEFRITLPNIRLFGIGLGDNDGGSEQISINGGPPIALQGLPGHVTHGQERAYYLLIKAVPGEEPIRTVAFRNAYSIIGDHLILKQGALDPNRPLQLVLDLVDGSRVIGTPAEKTIKLRFFGADVEIPYASIASFELNSGNRNAAILLGNGDRITADVLTNRWRITTAFGEQSFSLQLISRIAVTSGSARPQAAAVGESVHLREATGHYYVRITARLTWNEALDFAGTYSTRVNGVALDEWHLATITDAAENAFVFEKLLASGASGADDTSFLGAIATDGSVGNFKWVTREPFIYTNFAPGQPDVARENVLEIGGIWGPGWNNQDGPGSPAEVRQAFILEHEPVRSGRP